jgi:hypothetical protein
MLCDVSWLVPDADDELARSTLEPVPGVGLLAQRSFWAQFGGKNRLREPVPVCLCPRGLARTAGDGRLSRLSFLTEARQHWWRFS